MKRCYNAKEVVEAFTTTMSDVVAKEDIKKLTESFEEELERFGEFKCMLVFEADEIEDEEFGMVLKDGKWSTIYLASNNNSIHLMY